MKQLDLEQILKGEGSPVEREEFFARLAVDEQLRAEYYHRKSEQTFATLPNKPKLTGKAPQPLRRVSLASTLTRIAAVLFLPLCGYFIHDLLSLEPELSEYVQVAQSDFVNEINYRVDRGVKGHVLLADSTQVWLNSDSNLKVPATFDNLDKRVVELSGEGYFVVKSDVEHPFYIKTPQDVLVKVTGTEFNLTAYAERSDIHLALVKGAVEILKNESPTGVAVKPNEEAIVGSNRSEVVASTTKKVNDKTVWKDGTLKFVNTPMREMIVRLERWYGVEIHVQNPSIYDAVFTAMFREESIVQVLDLLEFTSGIDYTMKDNLVVLSKK